MLKVIEVLAESTKSWEDAARQAVAQANKTVRGIKSVYVQEQSCTVEDDKITKFRVNVKISFSVEGS